MHFTVDAVIMCLDGDNRPIYLFSISFLLLLVLFVHSRIDSGERSNDHLKHRFDDFVFGVFEWNRILYLNNGQSTIHLCIYVCVCVHERAQQRIHLPTNDSHITRFNDRLKRLPFDAFMWRRRRHRSDVPFSTISRQFVCLLLPFGDELIALQGCEYHATHRKNR